MCLQKTFLHLSVPASGVIGSQLNWRRPALPIGIVLLLIRAAPRLLAIKCMYERLSVFTRLTWVNRSEAKRLMGAGGLAGRTYTCWPASICGLVEVQNKAHKMFKVNEVVKNSWRM